MYNPHIPPESDSETEPDTGSDTSDTASVSSASTDGEMVSLEHWRQAARALIPEPVRSMLPPAGDDVPDSPIATENGRALFNTEIVFVEERRTHVIMVNSLDRDQQVYPLPTQARLKLPRIYKNVERIDIVQVKFFCGLYAISAARKNNGIWVTDPSGTRFVTVPDGTYTLGQLTSTLATSLSLGSSLTYTVTWNSVTGRITIAATGSFSLLFESKLPVYQQTAYSEWGLGWNLGWGGQPVDLTGATTYTADHWPRLVDDYVYLQLNETEHMNDVDHTDLEVTSMTQDSTGQVSHYFGKLLLNNYGCWAQTFVEAPKAFKPVLGRLERLMFTWTDRHGSILSTPDAASCDWHMALRITEIVEVQKADTTLTQSLHVTEANRSNL